MNIPTILKNGNTYLHLAAKTGQIEAYKETLNEEEDKNIRNECDEIAFNIACKNGGIQIVHLLLKSIDSQ